MVIRSITLILQLTRHRIRWPDNMLLDEFDSMKGVTRCVE